MRIPGITVDTHFGRLVRRWRWTALEDPVKVEFAIGDLIERKEWTLLSHRVIFHGRRVCHAKKPDCEHCALAPLCPSAGLAAERMIPGAKPTPSRAQKAKAAAAIAGCLGSTSAGFAPESVRTVARKVEGTIRAMCARKSRSISHGSWSGTRRKLSLTRARAGMTPLPPAPW